MLTLDERAQVVKVLHYFCSFHLFPVRVDTERWELCPGAGALWRTLACSISYGLFVANTSYKVGSLLYVLFLTEGTPLHQIMIHGILAVGFLMIAFWYYVLFIKHADVNAQFVRTTLTCEIGKDSRGYPMKFTQFTLIDFTLSCHILGTQPTILDVPEATQQHHSLRQRSLQDLIAIWMPHMVLMAAVTVGACYLYDPTMKQLLYSALPESYKNWVSFGILWTEEVRLTLFATGLAIPVWQVQILAFDLATEKLRAVGDATLAK